MKRRRCPSENPTSSNRFASGTPCPLFAGRSPSPLLRYLRKYDERRRRQRLLGRRRELGPRLAGVGIEGERQELDRQRTQVDLAVDDRIGRILRVPRERFRFAAPSRRYLGRPPEAHIDRFGERGVHSLLQPVARQRVDLDGATERTLCRHETSPTARGNRKRPSAKTSIVTESSASAKAAARAASTRGASVVAVAR